MANPATGSANPSASLPALWGYMVPALDHIIRSPTNDLTKAPAIDPAYHMGVHTAVYNYFTNKSTEAQYNPPPARGDKGKGTSAVSGMDLYHQLDDYFGATAREVLLGTPHDDSTLVHYLIPCFNRYSAGAKSINRLLNYVNRHYVKRAVDEDRGWLRLNDVLDAVAKTITEDDDREQISQRLKERRTEELKKYGYKDGGPAELYSQAEAYAEAASPPDRVVPLLSLAYRRFRIDVIEPLLAIPKVKKKSGKNKRPPPSNGDKTPGPKGRLARSVKELLETKGGDEDEKRRLASGLLICLKTCGIRADHPLRKRLEKFLVAEV
ncbi:hypothetical protein GLOTRDRAFT_124844 [Gloeophyllum trabeum ATCC 11539]|uniref:Uncharacterized protein n=1 Tax=Gloeophyllum trabeum (strain ATCC 11539 / FP-39264 / Madison 617) TaxID=670483 RepID=S7S140_GLOTA|nr:uncharacterized protein GLOTRDRAFT_124844 [Gloeophyllum trabeum ATCC 11539]EPQ61115.1 hypothetical protein GLOTRDRAFT_124844 [Gloeophyllum trabeum ATCC 11539]